MDAAAECARPFLDLPVWVTVDAVDTLDVDAFFCASPIATRAAATTVASLADVLLFVLLFFGYGC